MALAAKAARLKAEAEGVDLAVDEGTAQEYPNLWQGEQRLFASRQNEFKTTVAIFRQQIAQHEQELAEIKAKLRKLENGYALANKELKMTMPLAKEGAVSEVEVIRLQRQVNDIRGEFETTKLAIPRIESKYREAQEKLTEFELSFRNKARKELNEATTELAGLDESNVALADRVERTAVRSPVKGTVKQLLVHTVGGVIKPGMNLIEIVPIEDTLLVEAQIRPANIAFLRPGQKAIVKLTAYDYSIYGGLSAKLEHISADSILDNDGNSHYLVRVRTDKNYLGDDEEKLPIIPGMTTYVDILTGKKTVLSYVLKPLLRAKERALRER
jgi:adhesin transport system membrane fusion protein